MMNCREATRLMSEAQDRKLTLTENAELKFHTLICNGCRNFGNQMGSLRSFMQEFANTPEPLEPDSDKERFGQNLKDSEQDSKKP